MPCCAPCALPGLIYLGVTTVVNDEKGVLGFMVLDERPYSHHQVQVRIVSGNGEDVGVEAIFFTESRL